MKTPRFVLKTLMTILLISALAFSAASEETFNPNIHELNPSYPTILPYEPPAVHFDYPEVNGIIDYMQNFGEPNNTREEAYILDTEPTRIKTYFAALSGNEQHQDVDFYRIHSPAYGSQYFSGWLKITILSRADADFQIRMWTPGDIWTPTIYKTASDRSRGFWLGLAQDASVTIAVELRFESGPAQPVQYRIEVASDIIGDSYELDDEDPDFDHSYFSNNTSCDCSVDPRCLCNGTVRSSYIAPVFDGSGNVIGLPDKYYFYHNSCFNEAVNVSRRVRMGYNNSDGGSIFDFSEPTPSHYEDGWYDFIDHTDEINDARWVFLSINNPKSGIGTDAEGLCAGHDEDVWDDDNNDGVPDYYQFPYVLRFTDRGECCAGDCDSDSCGCDNDINDDDGCNCQEK